MQFLDFNSIFFSCQIMETTSLIVSFPCMIRLYKHVNVMCECIWHEVDEKNSKMTANEPKLEKDWCLTGSRSRQVWGRLAKQRDHKINKSMRRHVSQNITIHSNQSFSSSGSGQGLLTQSYRKNYIFYDFEFLSSDILQESQVFFYVGRIPSFLFKLGGWDRNSSR